MWSAQPDEQGCAVATCAFCGVPVDAATFLWPECLCRFFASWATSRRDDGDIDDAFVERLGRAVDQTVDCVCAKCADGWIQRLDDDVLAFLLPMVSGDEIALSRRRQHLLAVWAAKTAAIIECMGDSQAPTSRWAYECLRRGEIRIGTQVLIGRYDGNARLLAHTRDNVRYTIAGTGHQLQRSTFVIGKLFMQVLVDAWQTNTPISANNAGDPLIALVPRRRRKIFWPPTNSIYDALDERIRLEEEKDARDDVQPITM